MWFTYNKCGMAHSWDVLPGIPVSELHGESGVYECEYYTPGNDGICTYGECWCSTSVDLETGETVTMDRFGNVIERGVQAEATRKTYEAIATSMMEVLYSPTT